MINFLQEKINEKIKVNAIFRENNWLIFDTNEDLENVFRGI